MPSSMSESTTVLATPLLERNAQRARRGLLIYFAMLIPLSALFEGLLIAHHTASWLFIPLMWTPAFSSLVARLVLHKGISDISFRLGGRRGLFGLMAAFLLPPVIGLLAYGIAQLSGLTHFTGHPGQFALLLLLTMTLGPILEGILVAGEEIGWRGYMLTRLIDARLPAPILLSGLIWGLWHTPLIISGLYAAGSSPWLSVALFMGSITTFAFVFARLRLETGSIWPPVLLHATWNAVIQGAFDPSTTGGHPNNWTGESGVITLLVIVIITILFSLGRWRMIRALPKRGESVLREELSSFPTSDESSH